MNTNRYIYYGWIDNNAFRYSVNKYPIIKEQSIIGIKTYTVEEYLVIGEDQSTRYIEPTYMDKELRLKYDRIGMMSLDYTKVQKWVRDHKEKREMKLIEQLERLQKTEIEDCGE